MSTITVTLQRHKIISHSPAAFLRWSIGGQLVKRETCLLVKGWRTHGNPLSHEAETEWGLELLCGRKLRAVCGQSVVLSLLAQHSVSDLFGLEPLSKPLNYPTMAEAFVMETNKVTLKVKLRQQATNADRDWFCLRGFHEGKSCCHLVVGCGFLFVTKWVAVSWNYLSYWLKTAIFDFVVICPNLGKIKLKCKLKCMLPKQ